MILGTLNKMKDRQALMIENKITFSYVRSSRAILRLNNVASVSTYNIKIKMFILGIAQIRNVFGAFNIRE